MVLCWRDSSRWDIVLDPFGNGLYQLYCFDYENEDDDEDEKQFNRHFRRLPLGSLLSNCPAGGTFSERSLGKNLVPYKLFFALQGGSTTFGIKKFGAKLASILENEHSKRGLRIFNAFFVLNPNIEPCLWGRSPKGGAPNL
jgi:hypothetical protein